MIVYRLAQAEHIHDMSGVGAQIHGGRWNMIGIPCLYASEHVSLSVLELLVNALSLEYLKGLELLEIEIPEDIPIITIEGSKLKKEWHRDILYTQWMGTEMLMQNNILLFKCPSAIIHNEWNYVFNPKHDMYKRVRGKVYKRFHFDERLWRNG